MFGRYKPRAVKVREKKRGQRDRRRYVTWCLSVPLTASRRALAQQLSLLNAQKGCKDLPSENSAGERERGHCLPSCPSSFLFHRSRFMPWGTPYPVFPECVIRLHWLLRKSGPHPTVRSSRNTATTQSRQDDEWPGSFRSDLPSHLTR